MFNKIIAKAKKLIFNLESGAGLPVPNPRNSDIYLVSYPKSGNTWMRYLLAYAIWPDLRDLDLVEMASYVPSVNLENDCIAMLNPDAPCNQLKHRLIKSHTAFDKNAMHTIKRAIYIVRDGRDAIVSYWHYCNQRDQTMVPFSDFIELSARQGHSYGPWKDHVLGWLNAPLETKLIIRYEDMLSDTTACLRKALEFAEIDLPDDLIQQAVNRASFASLKKLEQTRGFNLDQLRTVEFVRKGKKGSWLETFGPGDLERFRKFHGSDIDQLGYSWQ